VTLKELLAGEAADLPGAVATVAADGSETWSRRGRPIAIVSADGSSVELALDPAVADAAARTPDVTLSNRGPGWVVFAPRELDGHASDRVVAWLASAHRRAEPQN
jgi:hypothetical protein